MKRGKTGKKAKTENMKKGRRGERGFGWASSMASAASLGAQTPGLKHFSPPA
jgi:hypothetical protein